MNRLFFIVVLLLLVSCNKETEKKEPLYPEIKTETSDSDTSSIELGKELFNGKGQCATCHKTKQNILGPSIVDIISIYKNKNADIVQFLKGNLDPIVDPSQFQVMQVNLEITKKMSDKELQAIVDYMNHLAEK